MKHFLLVALLAIACSSFSQVMPLTLEPDGGNRKASVSEQVGIVKIAINYNRPRVKGREGKIWNTTVAHYGFVDLGHGTSHAAPWRAGANENTTMSFFATSQNRRQRSACRHVWIFSLPWEKMKAR
jgi:hypothetical protein